MRALPFLLLVLFAHIGVAQSDSSLNKLEMDAWIHSPISDSQGISRINTTASIDTVVCDSYTVPSGLLTYATPGTFFTMDTIPNAAGCDSILSINITIAEVNTNVTYTFSTLTAELTGAIYQWVSCPAYDIIGVATSRNFDPAVIGLYAVIIDDGFCIDTSSCYSIDWAEIEENPLQSAMVYPNPNNGVFKISFAESFHGNIEVYSIEGSLLKTIEIQNKMGFDFQLEGLASGNYTLVLKSEDQIAVKIITID